MSKGVIIVPEVPTHCRECDYFSMFCKITGTRLYYDKDGRMDNCPIITIRADIDGKGKNDVEEIAFDFDREIKALEKQIKEESHIKLGEAIGSIFSDNEIIALWEIDKLDKNYSNRIWKGMAWNIPDRYRNCKNWRIFGAIPDSIIDADILNIRLN